jgi:hypothetical protein
MHLCVYIIAHACMQVCLETRIYADVPVRNQVQKKFGIDSALKQHTVLLEKLAKLCKLWELFDVLVRKCTFAFFYTKCTTEEKECFSRLVWRQFSGQMDWEKAHNRTGIFDRTVNIFGCLPPPHMPAFSAGWRQHVTSGHLRWKDFHCAQERCFQVDNARRMAGILLAVSCLPLLSSECGRSRTCTTTIVSTYTYLLVLFPASIGQYTRMDYLGLLHEALRERKH